MPSSPTASGRTYSLMALRVAASIKPDTSRDGGPAGLWTLGGGMRGPALGPPRRAIEVRAPLAEAAPMLLEPLPILFADPHEALPLIRFQDLLHVELHQRELLLKPRTSVLARLDQGLHGLAAHRVSLDGLLVRELLLLQIGAQVDETRFALDEDLLQLRILLGRQLQLLRDPRAFPPLALGETLRQGSRRQKGPEKRPGPAPHRLSSPAGPVAVSSPCARNATSRRSRSSSLSAAE